MSQDEMLDIVDENDNVIMQASKKEYYMRKLRPRIVNIAVIDPDTRKVAIQIRGENVSWQPGYYCISACGHVSAGEAWDTAAHRELREEMGIDVPLTFLGKEAFVDEFGNPFMLGFYVGEAPHSELIGDKSEVQTIHFMMLEQIRAVLDKGEKVHNLLRPMMAKLFN